MSRYPYSSRLRTSLTIRSRSGVWGSTGLASGPATRYADSAWARTNVASLRSLLPTKSNQFLTSRCPSAVAGDMGPGGGRAIRPAQLPKSSALKSRRPVNQSRRNGPHCLTVGHDMRSLISGFGGSRFSRRPRTNQRLLTSSPTVVCSRVRCPGRPRRPWRQRLLCRNTPGCPA
jgi:hypothetical protein